MVDIDRRNDIAALCGVGDERGEKRMLVGPGVDVGRCGTDSLGNGFDAALCVEPIELVDSHEDRRQRRRVVGLVLA